MSRFVFSLTDRQTDAVVRFGAWLESWGWAKRGSWGETFLKATLAIEEQRVQQEDTYEQCDKCKGSGWVERL